MLFRCPFPICTPISLLCFSPRVTSWQHETQMIGTHVTFSMTLSPLSSDTGQLFRFAPWTGELTSAAGFPWPCGGHEASLTRIQSLWHLYDILNVAAASFRSWMLASLLCYQYLSISSHVWVPCTGFFNVCFYAQALRNKERYFRSPFWAPSSWIHRNILPLGVFPWVSSWV